jgi:hypothetical protein
VRLDHLIVQIAHNDLTHRSLPQVIAATISRPGGAQQVDRARDGARSKSRP